MADRLRIAIDPLLLQFMPVGKVDYRTVWFTQRRFDHRIITPPETALLIRALTYESSTPQFHAHLGYLRASFATYLCYHGSLIEADEILSAWRVSNDLGMMGSLTNDHISLAWATLHRHNGDKDRASAIMHKLLETGVRNREFHAQIQLGIFEITHEVPIVGSVAVLHNHHAMAEVFLSEANECLCRGEVWQAYRRYRLVSGINASPTHRVLSAIGMAKATQHSSVANEHWNKVHRLLEGLQCMPSDQYWTP